MSDSRKCPVDMQALILAWEDEAEENAYYLDLEDGNVLLVRADLLDKNDLTDEIERHHDRYLYIPKADRKQLHEDLADFIAETEDDHLKSILDVAIESPNPLFACKKVWSDKAPKTTKEWDDFRARRVAIRIHQWLEANFIVIEGSEQEMSNS